MWYSTEEEARKACAEKEKEFFPSKFFVLKDAKQPNCYWAQRYIPEYHEKLGDKF